MKPPSADRHWFVIRTNPKCEEKAASNLRKASFEVYFPRQRIERKNKRTHVKHVIERPLMLRYIFIGMPATVKHFGFARACEGVEDFLRNNQVPLRIPFRAVEEIYLAEVDMEFDDTRAARIKRREEARTKKLTVEMTYPEGKAVKVGGDGPFAGFSGIVKSVTSQGHVQILVDIFSRMVPVELEPGQIEEVKIRVKTDKLAAA